MVTQRFRIADPDNVKDAVLEGLRSIEHGNFTELQTQDDLQRYFEDIVQRGEDRVPARRKATRE
jgi:hypothetical protein